ncbi:MAG: hypothetical protein ACRDR6_09485 [Pseudonocardiaceae bacterium]
MNTVSWIILAIVILAIIVVVVMATNWRKRASLQERFGPEYEREVAARGSERDAQRHLRDVADRRDQLDIRRLDPDARDRYARRWDAVQAEFVDRPGPALDEADQLVTDVMRDRGYSVENFGARADLIAADHPRIVEHYRAAHAARRNHHGHPGGVDTEELRQAFVHYRALFEELISG